MTQASTKYDAPESPSGTPEAYAGYEVFDPVGQRIGSAEELFFNGNGGPEYVRVRMGLLFAKHVLIPVQDVAFDRVARSLTLK